MQKKLVTALLKNVQRTWTDTSKQTDRWARSARKDVQHS